MTRHTHAWRYLSTDDDGFVAAGVAVLGLLLHFGFPVPGSFRPQPPTQLEAD
jgi:hypothetical protein